MKLVIEIPEREYKVICENNYVAVCACPNLLSNAIKNGTPIPDNATNKAVIKAMFPDGIKIDRSTAYAKRVTEDWLNSTYQKGGKE